MGLVAKMAVVRFDDLISPLVNTLEILLTINVRPANEATNKSFDHAIVTYVHPLEIELALSSDKLGNMGV